MNEPQASDYSPAQSRPANGCGPVLSVDLQGLPEGFSPTSVLNEYLAVRLVGMLTEAECTAMAKAVYGARSEWVPAFGGEQYSLGRAWYTHLEDGEASDYFSCAEESDALVERVIPGLRSRLHGWYSQLVGAQVKQRAGWTGAGVHIFPAGEKVAELGGSVHFDTEGLSQYHREQGKPALSLVVMIQAPQSGGDLMLWDEHYDGEHGLEHAPAGGTVMPYGTGNGVLQNCYRLHQIQPFTGKVDRLCLTLMGAEVDDGDWEVWF